MAAADSIKITIDGVQTHGSSPWKGVDPIVVSAQLINALQSIPSRQLDVTVAPAVLTIGKISGGLRGNIIPDRVEMLGTLRNFDNGVRDEMLARIERTVTDVAHSFGASGSFEVEYSVPVTWNDPELVERMLPSLERASVLPVEERPAVMGAEDFSYYQKAIPGFFYFLGVNPEGVSAEDAAANHSPYFLVNDAALDTGVRSLVNLALDYLRAAPASAGAQRPATGTIVQSRPDQRHQHLEVDVVQAVDVEATLAR
jgi:amidohydrolase